jgi:UDP:flavonoid glycosyltransferase YjiC (YdhE family)
MGGTLEFINASIPSVLWPHFADQHDLAVIMAKKGIGKILFNKERMVKDYD